MREYIAVEANTPCLTSLDTAHMLVDALRAGDETRSLLLPFGAHERVFHRPALQAPVGVAGDLEEGLRIGGGGKHIGLQRGGCLRRHLRAPHPRGERYQLAPNLLMRQA
jgi:hypothetical protein